jgi:hypothetical protein
MKWSRDSTYVWRSGDYRVAAEKVDGQYEFSLFFRDEPVGGPVMFADEAKQMAARHARRMERAA